MLTSAAREEVTDKVNRFLDRGFTSVGPPVDIYQPARIENIEAIVKALRYYKNSPSDWNAAIESLQETSH